MKLNHLLERAELLPRTETPKAEQIAKQFVDVITQRYGRGDDAEVDLKAKQMAGSFHQAIIKAIDEQLKYKTMKKVSPEDSVDVRA